MKIILSVVFVIFLGGCASGPTPREPIPECIRVGNYARTIATLRDMNIKEQEVEEFSQVPVVLTFPFKSVRREIYADTSNGTPADIFVQFYERCETAGYANLLSSLKQVEMDRIEQERKKRELEDLKLWSLTPSPQVISPVKQNKNKKR